MRMHSQADDLLCEAESVVREGLAAAVQREMVEAYDDLWSVLHQLHCRCCM